jgi:hypothetical protein
MQSAEVCKDCNHKRYGLAIILYLCMRWTEEFETEFFVIFKF